MTNPDIQQARKWADDNINGWHFTGSDRALAAARVIQSLPDQWIDAEKVREWMNDYIQRPRSGGLTVADVLTDLQNRFLTPPLPTLEELIEQGNDPQQYQWMQAEFYGEQGWITHVGEYASATIKHDGVTGYQPNLEITPLPGGAKMALPSLSVSDKSEAVSVETEDVTEESRTALPRPEDVPAGEPWIVEHDGHEWVGIRAKWYLAPWSIVGMDGLDGQDVSDSSITLVSRLVPEVKP